MIASNPVNHGRPNKLNCVEAIVSAFLLLNHPKSAESLLSRFGYGHAFIPLNQDLLDRYKDCEDSKDMIEAGEEYLNEGRRAKEKRREMRENGGEEEDVEDEEGEGDEGEKEEEEDDEDEEELELARKMGKVVRVIE